MKKNMSIKARITMWYAALIVSICAMALFFLFALAAYSQSVYCRETLQNASVIIMDEMEVEHGMLEIDSDIDDVPGVYAALFDLDGELIYGRSRVEMPFEDGRIRRAVTDRHGWMILDTMIAAANGEQVWLRLHMSADLSMGMYQSVARYSLWLLPLLAAVALLGGYLITARAFAPVGEMSRLASSIAGGADLSARIAVQGKRKNRDELYALAGTLNDMLERLENAFEHERQFTSDAAHELRTPLNGMRTQGEYALSLRDLEDKDEAICRMLEKNEEMRKLTDQLLMIARLDAGQIQINDDVDLTKRIEEIAEDMLPVAEEKNIVIETELDDVQICGNAAMLSRAVINLVDNAIRYGRKGGYVRIALRREGDDAMIRVSDDGCGIEQKALERVFERFWRADNARSTEGTGIGLAIVRAAARAHGGSVSVQSKAGEGSCFEIRIPTKRI